MLLNMLLNVLLNKKNVVLENDIAFFWMAENFIEYDWMEYVNNYPYTVSIFEMEETSFDPNVAEVFAEIADRLIKRYTVLHIVKDHIIKVCKGIDKDIFQKQIDLHMRWDETELYCYMNRSKEKLEPSDLCDIYIMIDMIHANMTIKCISKEIYEAAIKHMENVMSDMSHKLVKWEASI